MNRTLAWLLGVYLLILGALAFWPYNFSAPGAGQDFLTSPAEYLHGRSYVQDMVHNLIAFFPFGLILGAHFRARLAAFRTALVTLALSCFLSLAVECIQYLIPSRDSTLMDVLMNSAGGLIGAVLGSRRRFRALFKRKHEVGV